MRCREAQRAAARYRELADDDRANVLEHARDCASCNAAISAYLKQDAVLSDMPRIEVTAALWEAVAKRTVHRVDARWTRDRNWARLVAVTLAAVFFLGLGCLGVSASSLPGDILYPLKRAAEDVRLALTFREASREFYQNHLAAVRIDEVQAVLSDGRSAQVEFEGCVTGADGSALYVEGLPVFMGTAESWMGSMPTVGARVRVSARAQNGFLLGETLKSVAGSVHGHQDPGVESPRAGPRDERGGGAKDRTPDQNVVAPSGPSTSHSSHEEPQGGESGKDPGRAPEESRTDRGAEAPAVRPSDAGENAETTPEGDHGATASPAKTTTAEGMPDAPAGCGDDPPGQGTDPGCRVVDPAGEPGSMPGDPLGPG